MFTNRVVEEWNKLSKHVVSAGTVDIVKKRLDISMDDEKRWQVLGAQELPCVGQPNYFFVFLINLSTS